MLLRRFRTWTIRASMASNRSIRSRTNAMPAWTSTTLSAQMQYRTPRMHKYEHLRLESASDVRCWGVNGAAGHEATFLLQNLRMKDKPLLDHLDNFQPKARLLELHCIRRFELRTLPGEVKRHVAGADSVVAKFPQQLTTGGVLTGQL